MELPHQLTGLGIQFSEWSDSKYPCGMNQSIDVDKTRRHGAGLFLMAQIQRLMSECAVLYRCR